MLAVFVATRILVLLAAIIVEGALPSGGRGPPWVDRHIMVILTGSDAVYYLGIAADGYHTEPVPRLIRGRAGWTVDGADRIRRRRRCVGDARS